MAELFSESLPKSGGMVEGFLSKTKNPRLRQDFGEQAHRPAPMSLIGVFTDEPACPDKVGAGLSRTG